MLFSAGKKITVTANVTGGVGPYTYRWEKRNDSGEFD
jgi:hypothetical protein